MLLRLTLASIVATGIIVVALLGPRGAPSQNRPLEIFKDMVDQPKFKAQSASRWFADGRAQRLPPPGTVAWGASALQADPAFAADVTANYTLARNPRPIDRPLLERGQQLFTIYCAVCHGATGEGNGITTRYKMVNPPSYHTDRLREVPDGEVFKTITEGKGKMGPYGDRVRPDDRWAAVAYVRALQRAFHARIEDVPEERRKELER
ncbi:MAG: c-type cytochrome [Planctomycetota bacterium]|jgi:mono/diheme cytochrome c family protein